MSNLLDRMFDLFKNALLEANGKSNTFRFADREITFKPVDDKSLQGLFLFEINGERFSLTDSRESKMRLAASGLLGDLLIDKGLRGLADILDIKHRKGLAKARSYMDSLWGPFSGPVWRWNDPDAHRPTVAKVAVALVPFSVLDGGIPQSPRKARELGAEMPFVSGPDWKAALRLANRLAQLEEVKKRLEAARDANQAPDKPKA